MRHFWPLLKRRNQYDKKICRLPGNVLQYPAEEFNRYEGDYNALLKEKVMGSEVLQNAEWTTVPDILNNETGFISDGLHYNDETLKKLADYISR